MGKTLDNNLFYTKNKEGKMDIYNTAYANLILNKLGKTFSDVTYKKVNEYKQSNSSFQFDDCEEDIIINNYLACLALEGYQNVDNAIVNKILPLKQEDDSFYVDNKYNTKNIEKRKIEQTYMSIYILKKACYEINDMRGTFNWAKKQLKKYSKVNELEDLQYITYLCKTIQLFDKNEYDEVNISNNKLIENYIKDIKNNKNISTKDIDIIYSIAFLENEDLIIVSERTKKDIIALLKANMNTDILNMKALYEIKEAYILFGNQLTDLEQERLKLSLLGLELTSGGLSNSSYIGTPKETLMVLTLEKNIYNKEEKELLNNWMNVTLKNEFLGNERNWDNGDIYSMIAIKHLLNLEIEDKQFIESGLIKEISGELLVSKWREWFYAVKALQLINYKFEKDDLPLNYKVLITNLDEYGYMKFTSNIDLNQLVNAMILDGFATILDDYKDIKIFEKKLINMSNTSIEDSYFIKKRYYSTIALMSMKNESINVSETLKLANLLKYNYGYKSDKTAIDSDIQTTFQINNLKRILKGEKNEDIFR